jgi:hypothetical protein
MLMTGFWVYSERSTCQASVCAAVGAAPHATGRLGTVLLLQQGIIAMMAVPMLEHLHGSTVSVKVLHFCATKACYHGMESVCYPLHSKQQVQAAAAHHAGLLHAVHGCLAGC